MKLITDNLEGETTNNLPNKQPKFAVHEGEKPPRNPNWLADMNHFAIFLGRDIPKYVPGQPMPGKTIDLREYHVLNKGEKVTKLRMLLPGSPSMEVWVDTLAFSLGIDLIEVLYNGE
jgi:hypothetical protein